MPALRPADSKNASAVDWNRKQWVHDDPDNVEYRIVSSGMMCPLGWATGTAAKTGLEAVLPDGSALQWTAVYVDTIRLSYPAHLMVIEGIAPVWLFLGARLDHVANATRVEGPLVILNVKADPLYTVPYVFRNVVFGIPAVETANLQKYLKLVDIAPAMFSSLPPKDSA